jgi:predicted RNase H-like HicB family nuclease
VIDLKYSLVIEATNDPTFFGFYSPDLEGFTGIGHSIEDCVYQARWGMEEHLELLKKQSLPVPDENPNPKIVIQTKSHLLKRVRVPSQGCLLFRRFGILETWKSPLS